LKSTPFSSQLQEKKWDFKRDIYAPVFESVTYLEKVSRPSIAIIVISWRFIPDLEKNLATLRNLEPGDFEVILVDNGSPPGDMQSVMNYINTCVRLNRNTGAYLARNLGALFASAPILLFLDDDAIPHENLLSAHIHAHRVYNVCAVQGAVLPKTNNPLNAIPVCYYLGDKPFPVYSDIEGNSSYHADVFYRLGGWDDGIVFGGGGIDLAIRIANAGHRHTTQIYFPYAVIYHDHATHKKHKRQKLNKQLQSRVYLRSKHPHWYDWLDSWKDSFGKEEKMQINTGVMPVPAHIKKDIFSQHFHRALAKLSPVTTTQWRFHASFYMNNILRIGQRFLALNRLDESARWFFKITEHPHAQLQNYLGRAFYYLGRVQDKRSPGQTNLTPYYQKSVDILRISRSEPEDDYCLASAYHQLGNISAALGCLETFIGQCTDPSQVAVVSQRVAELWGDDKPGKAREFLKKGLKSILYMRHKQPGDIYRIASFYKQLSSYSNARKWYMTLLNAPAQRKLWAGAHFHLGEIALIHNRRSYARECFDCCLALLPGHRKAAEYMQQLNEND
jgi:GT2 family glycosyltransferase